MSHFLEFEKQIAALEGKIAELKHLAKSGDMNISSEVTKLESKAERLLRQTYANLTAWQKVQVARHPQRPHAKHYIEHLIDDFIPLAGDRLYAEDASIIGGIGRLAGRSVMVLGQEKGDDTETRIHHNFGMPKPEGYRKAIRLMQIADRFRMPVITFVDTPGAFPGLEAEDRGQSGAIAQAIDVSLCLSVPFISLIIGEGGSGGAIALATADIVMMLEHAVYSVITPEGCASILWRDANKKTEAAEAQKLTATELLKLKVIDQIIQEPLGGAHRDYAKTMAAVGENLKQVLTQFSPEDYPKLAQKRRQKFLNIGRNLAS
jgi:acetyl-CoA carboxylase carboxyl transferase subunit alpha